MYISIDWVVPEKMHTPPQRKFKIPLLSRHPIQI